MCYALAEVNPASYTKNQKKKKDQLQIYLQIVYCLSGTLSNVDSGVLLAIYNSQVSRVCYMFGSGPLCYHRSKIAHPYPLSRRILIPRVLSALILANAPG